MAIGGGAHVLTLGSGLGLVLATGGTDTTTTGTGTSPMSIGGGGHDTIFGGSGNLVLTIGGGQAMLALAKFGRRDHHPLRSGACDSAAAARHRQQLVPTPRRLPVTYDSSGNVVLQFGNGGNAHHSTLIGVTSFDLGIIALISHAGPECVRRQHRRKCFLNLEDQLGRRRSSS